MKKDIERANAPVRAWWRRAAHLGVVIAALSGCTSEPEADDSESARQGSGLDDDDSKKPSTGSKKDGGASSGKDSGSKGSSSGSSGSGEEDLGDGEETGDGTGSDTGGDGSGAGPKGSGSGWCSAKAVLDKYCTSCHDGAGTGGAPNGLKTYADLTAAAPSDGSKKVYEVVGERIHDSASPMPPKKTLSDAELKTLDDWIAAGAPAGSDPTCAGASAGGGSQQPVSDWDPSKCDAVYKLVAHGATADSPATVGPGQETHPQVYIDAPWGNEKVQAINFRPITDNAKVLHHWILYSGAAFLTGWAPGDDERSPFPPDVGMDMPTGPRSLRLDMHYFNTKGTKAEQDRSGVEVCVVKGANLRKNSAAVTMSFTSFGPVLAPAGRSNYESTGVCNVTARQPVHLMTASPHAHKYAVRMKFTVKKKNGQEIVMHDMPFKFGEQGSYGLSPEVILETGDKVITTCVYTNTTAKNITFGESTENEMCFNFASYYPKGALSCGIGLGR